MNMDITGDKGDSVLTSNFDVSKITKEIVTLSPPLKLKSHSQSVKSSPAAFILRNCLTKAECAALIELAENNEAGKSLFSETVVNLEGVDVVNQDVREGSRYILDSENIVSQLWTRIRPRIPTNLKGAVVTGLNERLRFLRYETGQKFAPHYDGTYSREDDPLEVSLITLQIYLNDNFEGGETNFLGDDDDDDKSGKNFEVDKVRITPETGMILVFEQDLMHEGAELKNGVKYTVRTDVMYSYSKKKNIMM